MPEVETVISVRGTAQRTVEPDEVAVFLAFAIVRPTKADALAAAAYELAQLTAALTGLGGRARTSFDDDDGELTWLATSVSTDGEFDHNGGPTGLMRASVSVELRVRRFPLLDRVATVLAAQEPLDVQHVQWTADQDNPAWARVRGDAITAALRRGRDYAAALGGSLARIVDLADTGLLAGDRGMPHATTEWTQQSAGGRSAGRSPSLDPVPQVLAATVEARFVAVGVSITGS